jgi:hypothetical protein
VGSVWMNIVLLCKTGETKEHAISWWTHIIYRHAALHLRETPMKPMQATGAWPTTKNGGARTHPSVRQWLQLRTSASPSIHSVAVIQVRGCARRVARSVVIHS